MNHLTTGQIAKLVGCAQRTVAKWIDNGILPGFRLPNGKGQPGERRVTRAAFDAFCQEHELVIVLPHGWDESQESRVESQESRVKSQEPEDDPPPEPPPAAEAALDGDQFHRAA